MAKATRNTAPPVPPPPDTITLELTLEEAQVLADIGMRIGGDPEKSRRKLVNSIREALFDVGIVGAYPSVDFKDDSTIYFKDVKK